MMKVREGGRVVNVVVLLATGVNTAGHREALGMRVATAETCAAWNDLGTLQVNAAVVVRWISLADMEEHRAREPCIAELMSEAPLTGALNQKTLLFGRYGALPCISQHSERDAAVGFSGTVDRREAAVAAALAGADARGPDAQLRARSARRRTRRSSGDRGRDDLPVGSTCA